MIRSIVAVVLVAWTCFVHAAIQVQPVMPQELVADYAHTLTAEQFSALSQKLREYFLTSSNVVVVVTIPSLEAAGKATIQDWNMMLADTWKPGNAKKDNGVIMTIVGTQAPYKVRINPGRGLEGPLTDVFCKRLIEDAMKPVLNKPGGYYVGINVAVDGLVKQIGKEFSPEVKRVDDDTAATAFLAVAGTLIVAFIIVILLVARRSARKDEERAARNARSSPIRESPSSFYRSTVRQQPTRTSSRSSEVTYIAPARSDYTSRSSDDDSSSSSSSPSFSVDSGGGFSGGGGGDS